MRARAAAGPLRTTACQYARSRFIQAQAFLTWTAALGVPPPPSPRRTSTPTPPATAPTSVKASARSWSGPPGTATSPGTWTSPASSPTPGRPSPSSAAWTCCAASSPAQTSRSAPRRRLHDAALRPAAQPHPAADRRRPVPRRCGPDLAEPRLPASPVPLRSTRCCTSSPTPPRPRPRQPRQRLAVPRPQRGQPADYRSMAPSSATTACRCAPRASPRCASSSSPSPPLSSPTPSASTTPPPPASTSTPAPPGAGTSQANGQVRTPGRTTMTDGGTRTAEGHCQLRGPAGSPRPATPAPSHGNRKTRQPCPP